MENKKKYELFRHMIEELDKGVSLINEYDSLLHDYDGIVMFQAESQLIKAIGDNPGVTASKLAENFGKTSSACSQLIRRLRKKEWIIQNRNEDNGREYNLMLTKAGEEIYKKHHEFEEACYSRTFRMLDDITSEDMQIYIKIQERLNKSFALDVEESKDYI